VKQATFDIGLAGFAAVTFTVLGQRFQAMSAGLH
jgi:hypothetical protein